MYKLDFYVPTAAKEEVKRAVFQAGAGAIGNYDCCCWETAGRGDFRPLSGSHPAIGVRDRLEFVEETKIELVVPDDRLRAVIDALLAAHPYETAAYQYYPVNGMLPPGK
ncbi:MAG: hypothetical protein PHS41_13285 [Victivallaceae bacterium]|nr:hypothetical protein [Victivallaceae bacterium]